MTYTTAQIEQHLARRVEAVGEDSPDVQIIRQLMAERDVLREWDNHFRAYCGYKRDSRPSPECLNEYMERMFENLGTAP